MLLRAPRSLYAAFDRFPTRKGAATHSAAPLWIASFDPPVRLPAHARLVDAFPAQAWFAGAERIVSAAGFNLMRQTRAFRGKQSVLPLPRRNDDQFERARRAFATERPA